MRAILVCVDYSDYLAVTAPHNRHHFDDVLVVTSSADAATQDLCRVFGLGCFVTDAFYDDGADFNKWKALEQGLDYFGRDGWLCIMDADVMWPNIISQRYLAGCLYTPFRRMMTDISKPIPPESLWRQFPRHHVTHEWSGFTQIFHGSDKSLGPAPWHQTNWKHAGGADSFFQDKWPKERKLRPNWECLHLGEPGQNWCGRSTKRLDGSTPEGSRSRIAKLQGYMQCRRATKNFDHEKTAYSGGAVAGGGKFLSIAADSASIDGKGDGEPSDIML